MAEPTGQARLSGGHDPRMTALQLDPETGFLETSRKDGISGQLKRTILDIYRSSGNLTDACLLNGVEPRVIRWHAAHDPAFKAALEECREQICDKAEGHIVQWMSSQKNVIDRLAWLRAHRPDRWNPKADVTVSHNVEVTQRLASVARQAISTTAEEKAP